MSVDFIPKNLCGTVFKKSEIFDEEDLDRYRSLRSQNDLETSEKNYYIGFTIQNRSEKSIALLIATARIFDGKNYWSDDGKTASVILEFSKNDEFLPFQSARRCVGVVLSRDFTDSEIFEIRKIVNIEKVKLSN